MSHFVLVDPHVASLEHKQLYIHYSAVYQCVASIKFIDNYYTEKIHELYFLRNFSMLLIFRPIDIDWSQFRVENNIGPSTGPWGTPQAFTPCNDLFYYADFHRLTYYLKQVFYHNILKI